MPGFSENPQPKNSSEKSEKPKKAKRDTDTANEVPESVREDDKEDKSDIEKLKSQESYEEVYEVEIDGEIFEIPVQVSYFEYPEHIQEDTGGVLGYERKEIGWRKLRKILLKDIPKERAENMAEKRQELREERRGLSLKLSNLKNQLEVIESEELEVIRRNFDALGRNIGKIGNPAEFSEKVDRILKNTNYGDYDFNEWPFNRFIDFKNNINRLIDILKKSGANFDDPRKRGVSPIEDYPKLMQKVKELLGKIDKRKKELKEKIASLESKKANAAHWTEKEMHKDENIEKAWSIISSLTDGKFPGKTCNHVMMDAPFQEIAKEEGFGAKRLSSPESFARLLKESSRDENERYPMSRFNDPVVVDIDSNKVESEMDPSVPEYEEEVQKKISNIEALEGNDSKFLMGRAGLSASNEGNFHAWGKQSISSVTWGFSSRNKAFKKYLKDAQNVISEVEGGPFVKTEPQEKTIEYFLEDMPKISPQFYPPGRERNHPWIPVIDGHLDIPNFRWCHAEYGYIPTEKNLNVVRFISKDIEEKNGTEAPGR